MSVAVSDIYSRCPFATGLCKSRQDYGHAPFQFAISVVRDRLIARTGSDAHYGGEVSVITRKVIVITGASSGIGKATALHLGERGAKVVLSARDESRLAEVTDAIERAGGQSIFRKTDVSKRPEMFGLVQDACDTYGRLDVLFSNAGAMPIGPFEDLRVDDWDEMVDVNIKGVLHGIAAALPIFRRQESGHFIHIVSTTARKTVPNQVVYSATKAAVLALSDGLRQELAGRIRVSTVSPGFTATGFSTHVKDISLRRQMKQSADKFAMSATAVAHAISYMIDQPNDVNVAEIITRSTAQP
jgi:NADP-dependent 3-hydroxy acid dehydrogenase YdfG